MPLNERHPIQQAYMQAHNAHLAAKQEYDRRDKAEKITDRMYAAHRAGNDAEYNRLNQQLAANDNELHLTELRTALAAAEEALLDRFMAQTKVMLAAKNLPAEKQEDVLASLAAGRKHWKYRPQVLDTAYRLDWQSDDAGERRA